MFCSTLTSMFKFQTNVFMNIVREYVSLLCYPLTDGCHIFLFSQVASSLSSTFLFSSTVTFSGICCWWSLEWEHVLIRSNEHLLFRYLTSTHNLHSEWLFELLDLHDIYLFSPLLAPMHYLSPHLLKTHVLDCAKAFVSLCIALSLEMGKCMTQDICVYIAWMFCGYASQILFETFLDDVLHQCNDLHPSLVDVCAAFLTL